MSVQTSINFREVKRSSRLNKKSDISNLIDSKVIKPKKGSLEPTNTKNKNPQVQINSENENNYNLLKENLDVSPSKIRKLENGSPKSPSGLMTQLKISTPRKGELKPKKLFCTSKAFQHAKQALHSNVPTEMIAREVEVATLSDFLQMHLNKKTSGSMYISGPPGTGKTATLMKILESDEFHTGFKHVYINCVSMKSAGSVYRHIADSLKIKVTGKTEKDYLTSIEKHLTTSHKMILLILDEIDGLDTRKQSILYTIFEWPAKPTNRFVLIGIANALDLTDRILPRLQAHVSLKPKLLHFAPYTKQQVIQILTKRLEEADVTETFSPVAIQFLAGKIAAVSGDVRRALDIGRRAIELTEQSRNTLEKLNDTNDKSEIDHKTKKVELKEIMAVLNNVYQSANNLNNKTVEETFPLQQKILLCTLILILKKGTIKDVTVGKLYDVYKRVCNKRNILAVDITEFVSLCSLISSRGIIQLTKHKVIRMQKVCLNWDEEEVASTLSDKQLVSSILDDVRCLDTMF